MYLPQSFVEDRPEILAALIARHPLGLLLTIDDGEIKASHLPFLLQPATATAPARLRGHLARANPHGRSLDGAQGLLCFQGPDSYVSPSYYPSKQRDPRQVPTWNYAVVHARGPVRTFDDAASVLAIVTELSAHFERAQPRPWSVADAPADYVDKLLQAIIGVELTITSLQGKWKMSQNRLAEDAAGVAAALSGKEGERERAVGQFVAEALRRRPPTP